MEKICGIYKITSPSKKIYIGRSVDINKRWKVYRRLSCKSQRFLYHSLVKYGADKHRFEIIEHCSENELDEKEKYYVDLFQTFNSKYGLNIKDGGGKEGMMSQETKNKIGKSNRGKKRTEYQKLKLSIFHKGNSYKKGKKASPLTRSRISASRVGIKLSDQHKKNIGEALLGKVVSEETREKIKASKLGANNHFFGKKFSDEHKNKISNGNKGKKRSKEAIQKYINAWIIRKQNKNLKQKNQNNETDKN